MAIKNRVKRFVVGERVRVITKRYNDFKVWWEIENKDDFATIALVKEDGEVYDYQLLFDGDKTPGWLILDFALEPIEIKEDITEWL